MSITKPTIYLITAYKFNHRSERKDLQPLDSRFLQSDKNYIYYLIDKKVPDLLKNKPTVLEYDLDPLLHKAGGEFFGEWSFLLAEEKHAFCTYPLFMISSRFYEKNNWLHKSIDDEWDKLFSYLNQYGWGYLPSYDRPLRWIDLSWEKKVQNEQWKRTFFPFTNKTYELTEALFGTNIPNNYRYTADLFCNYIGFRSRKDLLEYTRFYRPIIDFFFQEDYSLKRDLSPYIKKTNTFRNEKPFTFILELLCHLFFFKQNKSYFALHYDGYYEVNEDSKRLDRLENFPIPLSKTVKRRLAWEWKRLNTEGCFLHIREHIKPFKAKIMELLQTSKG